MPPDNISAIATLGWIARYKAYAAKTNVREADAWLAGVRVPESIKQTCKSAIGAGSTTDSSNSTTIARNSSPRKLWGCYMPIPITEPQFLAIANAAAALYPADRDPFIAAVAAALEFD